MQADLLLVAALLRRGRSLDHCSSALSLVAVVFGLAPWLGAAASLILALICAALLSAGLAEKYWALRVALDAELFQRLIGDEEMAVVEAMDPAEFDQAHDLAPHGFARQPGGRRDGVGVTGL